MSRKNLHIHRLKTFQTSKCQLPFIGNSKPHQRPEEVIESRSTSNNLIKAHNRDKSVPTHSHSSLKYKPPSTLKSLIVTRSLPKYSLEDDKFYYKNLLKGNGTAFQDMIEFVPDSNSPFVYMARANRTVPTYHPVKRKIERPNYICKCPILGKKQALLRHVHFIWPQKLKDCASSLRKVFCIPKNYIKSPGKVVIFTIENTLHNKAGLVRPKLIESLKKLQKKYQIVFVTEKHPEQFLNYVTSSRVLLSGLYEKTQPEKRLVDYTVIFKDFQVASVTTDCVLVTSINCPLEELESRQGEDLITFRHGMHTNLLVHNPPFPSSKPTKYMPALLLPSLVRDESTVSMHHLVKLLTSNPIFGNTLCVNRVEFVRTAAVFEFALEKTAVLEPRQREMLQDHKLSKVCKLHMFPADDSTPTRTCDFGILKLSSFPSSAFPSMFSI